MSIVSGFMMGAAIGNNIRQMFTGGGCDGVAAVAPQPQQPLALVAQVSGRRRYRAAVLTPELAALLEEKLGQLAFLTSFAANSTSGSLLFTYDPADERKMDALALWLERYVFTRPQAKTEVQEVEESAAVAEAHAGSLTRSVRNMARSFSAWIKAHTSGIFDISSLASCIFALRGLRKMLLTKTYPSGAQMLWWALALMRGWRTV